MDTEIVPHDDEALLHAKLQLPEQFRIDEITPVRAANPGAPAPSPPLGILSRFVGEFEGRGFNMIFRPNSGPPTTTTFPNPVTPVPPTPPSENVLELNLTKETLAFSGSLGRVPNRGLQAQNDIFLNGVPYVQTINDVTNAETGKGDAKAIAIHFEPGLWMNIPETKTVPPLPNSLVRMASIPHGTTINAQCLAPTTSIDGPPNIPSVSITPFVIGSSPPHLITFASQTASNNDTPRIPQDLSKFIAAGTITQATLNDPNTVLRDALAGKTVIKTTFFTVSTSQSPFSPEFGGGTDNIAFLEGDQNVTKPNANAVRMTATFWIETLEHKISVPPYKLGDPPLRVAAPAGRQGDLVPVFKVTPPRELNEPFTITVTSTQIQYSQVVFLNFAGLTWPHVSVATLVPTEELEVPLAAWA